jgi:hypothetical protein
MRLNRILREFCVFVSVLGFLPPLFVGIEGIGVEIEWGEWWRGWGRGRGGEADNAGIPFQPS